MSAILKKVITSSWLCVILFATYPALFLFAENSDEAKFSVVLVPASASIAVSVFLVLLSARLLRDLRKACLLVFFWLVLFYAYGHVFNLLREHVTEAVRHRHLWPAWGALLIAGTLLLIRTRQPLHSYFQAFNIVGLVLVVGNLWSVVEKAGLSNIAPVTVQATSKISVATKPDIYYIILDGYASQRTLRELYKYDSAPFLGALESKGFHVVRNSHSNYAMTQLSLASSLNIDYLQSYIKDPSSMDHRAVNRLAVQLVQKNRVASFLKSQGYKFVNVGSTYGVTADIPMADEAPLRDGDISFIYLLANSTMLKPFGLEIAHESNYQHILRTFEYLDKSGEVSDPKFVFAHIIAPHPPYLFSADGTIKEKAEYSFDGSAWKDKESYLEQLTFISKRVLASIELILARSKTPPIIILQSDHGPASEFNDNGFEPIERVTDSMLRERMGILNAYHLPGADLKKLPIETTPVNTFCLVFQLYFNQKCAMHDNRSYYSTYDIIYPFHDVTARVK